MPVSPPLPRELFGDGPDTVTKFEALKDKIKSVISNTDAARARGDILGFENKVGTVYSPKAQAREILAKAGLEADLTKEEIFESVDRFYRAYYLRPKPILRIIKTMLADKDVCVRRLREGWEFFRTLRERKADMAVAKAAAA